jgi:hypothetical protein
MARQGLLFRWAMLTCLLMRLATGSPGWAWLAVVFAFGVLAIMWALETMLETLAS